MDEPDNTEVNRNGPKYHTQDQQAADSGDEIHPGNFRQER
jgi:hypothetical protein